jgi:polysaccharide biosynthesis transport protein
MRPVQHRDLSISDAGRTIWRCRRRCAATMVIVLVLTAAYIIFAPPCWMASQAIIVRNDAAAQFGPTSRLHQDEDVKNTQQTLQEIVSSRSVLRNSLQCAGPPTSGSTESWPSEEAIVELRRAVSLAPPKGMEFGKTAVFYLKVKDPDRDRAIRLTDAIYAELGKAFGQLRAAMNQNAISELKASATLTEANLDRATRRIAEVEKEAGVDLVALRMLHQSPVGDIPIFHTLSSGLDELRRLRQEQAQQTALLGMLRKAEVNPLLLAAAPRELMECHPGLSRLIQGLSESRLRSFAGASKLSDEHPEMISLRREETNIREGIRQELSTAIQGVSAAIELGATRRAALEKQVDELNRRLGRLTNIRAEYSNLVAQVEQRRNQVEQSQRNLAEARAACAAATTSSLLSRVDSPDGGLRPVSPSRALLGLSGVFASLLAAFGVVLLTAPIGRREDSARASSPLRETGRYAAPPRHTTGERLISTRVAEPVLAGQQEGH